MKLSPKKLLVASIGVASISFTIGCDRHPPGNLAMPDPSPDGGRVTPSSTTDPDAGAPAKQVPPIPPG